jgi:serine/threonine-protein kinase
VHDRPASYEQIIGGRYALYGPIASGGMATVHFGRQLGAAGFARTVAIKRLRGEFLDSHEFISTLLDEARLASRIRHPNVVATLDMVAAEDEVFLVMEYVAGESLSRLLAKLAERRERVSPQLAAGVLCGVLYALHAAHEATDERGEPLGIVHRDVSPQNVLVGRDGLARLLDFGIAKGKGRLQTTRAGQLKGKVSYMAPEQILGEEPDRRSDIYAAAVVLWEVLTGQRMFASSESAADHFNLIPKILEADIEPPSAVAGVPAVLDGIVMRALNRQRDARYATARDFAIALEESVGVATARQIGEWVERIAAEELSARAEQLATLEASAQKADRHSFERLADAAAARQRKKRLASRRATPAQQAPGQGSAPDELEETKRARPEPPPSGTALDAPTVADDPDEPTPASADEPEETTATRPRPVAASELHRQRLGSAKLARAAAEAAERAPRPIPRDDEGEMITTPNVLKGIADEPTELEEEAPTAIHAPSALLKGPPKLPITTDSPRPSDYLRSERPIPSDAPQSFGGDDIRLPVRSNRALMIALVLAAVIATAAAVVKMLG